MTRLPLTCALVPGIALTTMSTLNRPRSHGPFLMSPLFW
jgi:hypothetical protein